jgi:hypothetical protein
MVMEQKNDKTKEMVDKRKIGKMQLSPMAFPFVYYSEMQNC